MIGSSCLWSEFVSARRAGRVAAGRRNAVNVAPESPAPGRIGANTCRMRGRRPPRRAAGPGQPWVAVPREPTEPVVLRVDGTLLAVLLVPTLLSVPAWMPPDTLSSIWSDMAAFGSAGIAT